MSGRILWAHDRALTAVPLTESAVGLVPGAGARRRPRRLRARRPAAFLDPLGGGHGGGPGGLAGGRRGAGGGGRGDLPEHQGLRPLPIRGLYETDRHRGPDRLRRVADRHPTLVPTAVALLPTGPPGHTGAAAPRRLHLGPGAAGAWGPGADGDAPGHRRGHVQRTGADRAGRGARPRGARVGCLTGPPVRLTSPVRPSTRAPSTGSPTTSTARSPPWWPSPGSPSSPTRAN